MYKILKSYFFIFTILIFGYSCNVHKDKPDGLKYIGTWVAYDKIRSRYDTAQILKYHDSVYSYIHFRDDTSHLILSKEGNLIDLKDSSFIIRFNAKADQLILKNILNGEDLFVNRLK